MMQELYKKLEDACDFLTANKTNDISDSDRFYIGECFRYIKELSSDRLKYILDNIDRCIADISTESKMEDEYAIKVSMTPHRHDYPECPYFWCVLKNNCNVGHGWSKTPRDAGHEAFSYYLEHITEGDI